MLTNRSEEQVSFFKPDIEAVYFNTSEEMLDKAKFYLSHIDQREKIRIAGMKAVAPHTYEMRAIKILEFLDKGAITPVV